MNMSIDALWEVDISIILYVYGNNGYIYFCGYIIMKYLLIAILILSGFIPQVWSAQLDATILVEDKTISPTFSFLRIIYIEYPEGGEIANLLRNQNQKISLVLDSESNDMRNLVNMINENLESLPSTVYATRAEVKYHAILTGNQNSAVIEFRLELTPTITNPVITENGDARIIDANWRGISLDSPIIFETIYGEFNINTPKSALEIMIPDVMKKLENSDVKILEIPLIDSDEILKLPLHRWHSLFDNTAILPTADIYNFTGKNVVTHFSMGECSLDSGFCQDRKWIQELDLDKEYKIVMIESRDDASIAVEGYAEYSSLGPIETFETSLSSPVSEKPATDEFPATVMYGMASIAAIGGGAMFVFSNRKTKKDLDQGQTGIDPAHLRSFESNQSAGSWKTNRGESYLKDYSSRTAV